MRTSRDELFMRVAHLFAEQSTCNRGNVGAVIVQDRRIISTGYNGSPPGAPHCTDVGCDETDMPWLCDQQVKDTGLGTFSARGCQRTIHAEANAILWAARHGVPLQGTTMYSTHAPCLTCAQAIVQAGIHEFHFKKDYRLSRLDVLFDAKLRILQDQGDRGFRALAPRDTPR